MATIDAPPEQGIRLWRDILNFLAARSPEVSRDQFDSPLDILPYLQAQETALIKAFDANDWIKIRPGPTELSLNLGDEQGQAAAV